jgi:hypothetical protein
MAESEQRRGSAQWADGGMESSFGHFSSKEKWQKKK